MDNNQQVVGGFLKAILATERQIPYNPKFMDHELRLSENKISFLNIVSHPNMRVVLKPGETAVTRAIHPNPRYADTSNVILMRGTEYGLVVMFGREKGYARTNGKFIGDVPHLHASAAFMMAMVRHFKRIGKPISFVGSELAALEWIFSDSFTADLAEQVAYDKAAGIEVSDGLPPKKKAVYLGKAAIAANAKQPSKIVTVSKGLREAIDEVVIAVNAEQSSKVARHPSSTAKKPEPHPMDILPCRANGFKGRQATDEEKADFAEKIEAGEPIGNIEDQMQAEHVAYLDRHEAWTDPLLHAQ